jgi:ferrous iron transport protein B
MYRKKQVLTIDVDLFAQKLGVPVVPISARKIKGYRSA